LNLLYKVFIFGLVFETKTILNTFVLKIWL